ncbi:3-hydroxyacyl-CoA dehydrogenase [Amycolatopsis endophytica]|uniref:enoyl-CoA hydratase n=1 Tax=Amycolatopsis endophytica TaxID=860233 RepID=A0A853BAL3_9PSEU|nr:enoyl-CoA hydratase-related protein [Amycolatopsis endophytica]NYI91825.1 3-hydroxyacyl-CoA dehydrogenase [Amycolatopsis endophytica]
MDGVAVVRIDNPPVNASTAAVRAGLLSAVRAAARDDAVTSVVLIGTGNTFVTGSDLREFDGPLPRPQLPEVTAAIEVCAKPVVAAMAGPVLGGGFELALACDARVAARSTSVGLPEVGLGMLPGAGGTQRLPRLVGMARALHLVCSGERLAAGQAREAGIVDALAEEDLLGAAMAFARTAVKRNLLDRPVVADPPGSVEEAVRRALAAGEGRPQVVAATGAVLMSGAVPARIALAHERAEFDRLRTSGEARALRHLFFAERSATREHRWHRTSTGHTQPIAVIGAGAQGVGIARTLLRTGHSVVLVDTSREGRDRGTTAPEAGQRTGSITTTTELGDASHCGLVIDSIVDDLGAVKKRVLHDLGELLPTHTVIASHPCDLGLDELAGEVPEPSRVVGMHFVPPVHATGVVEVVRGARTSPATIARAVDLIRAMGKVPVVSAAGAGSLGGRVWRAYRTQCDNMLAEGAPGDQINRALRAFGMATGPFEGNGVVVDGGARRPFTDEEIVRRAVLAMANEATRLVDAGIATRASDVDLLMTLGYGFPRHHGGPAFWAAVATEKPTDPSDAPGAGSLGADRGRPQERADGA